MKFFIAAFLGAIANTMICALPCHAAGETKKLLFTVDETKVPGYGATLPARWARSFVYGAAAPSWWSPQAIFVLSVQTPSGVPTVPPTPAAVTLLSLSNAVLLTDSLPSAVQVVQADCTGQNTGTNVPEICPQLLVDVAPSKALPGRLVFNISKLFLLPVAGTVPLKKWVYIFDPYGAAGSPDRWFLADSSVRTVSFGNISGFTGPLLSDHPADTNFFIFKRTSGTQMQVYQVTTK